VGQPGRTGAQPLHLILEPVGDQIAASELLVTRGAWAVGVLRCGPPVAEAQLAERRVQAVELGAVHELVPCMSWCTRVGPSPAATASLRRETPPAWAQAIAHVRSSSAIACRQAARRTRARSRASRCQARRHAAPTLGIVQQTERRSASLWCEMRASIAER
jgi:hypothetical protein